MAGQAPEPMRRAMSFLTSVGGASLPTGRAVTWFPVVGLMIGSVLGGVWWLAGRAWPGLVAAAVVVSADLAITGLLHFDGLVDAADGLLPHLSVQRRLEVMAEPGVGAFGVGVGTAVLAARFAALATVRPSVLVLAGLWCASRTWMALAIWTVPYARAGGLVAAFLDAPSRAVPVGLLGLGASLGLLMAWRLWPGLACLGAGSIGALGVVLLARRRVGGFTGDVLGAAGMVGETVGLLVAAARW